MGSRSGLGGLVFPGALGIGYGLIAQLLAGQYTWHIILGVLIVKSFIWTFSLGSGTSGGILAPLLMIGGGLGAAMGHWLPGGLPPGAWPMISMAAVLAGSIGAPLTSAMLAVELTHNSGLLLPVLLASVASYGVSVLIQRRSILTERLSRRGFHLSREYSVDPMEMMTVREVMHTSVYALPVTATRKDAAAWLASMQERGGKGWAHWQRLFPLIDGEGKLAGVLTRTQMMSLAEGDPERPLLPESQREPATATPGETIRTAIDLMADSGLTVLPVVNQSTGKLVGMMQLADLLLARKKAQRREMDRETVIRMRWPFRHHADVAAAVAPKLAEESPEAMGSAMQMMSLDGGRPGSGVL